MPSFPISEIARKTGLHPRTVRNYIKEGKITSTFQDGQYIIEASEITKLPKPYKKHGQPAEREVHQETPFTVPAEDPRVAAIHAMQAAQTEYLNHLARLAS